MTDPSFTQTSSNPDRVLGGSSDLITRQVTLTDDQSQGPLARGAVLGFDGSLYARVHQAGSFGASTARAILAKDADPSGGDVTALVYIAGEFNEERLNVGGTVTIEQVREPLQANGIVLRKPVGV